MAQGKKISELNEVSSVTDNDEFLFVDKEGSGANSGVGGKTAKIKFSDLKSAIGAGSTGAKGASGDKGMKGEPGPRGLDGAGTQYWTQSPSDGDAVYYDAGNVGVGTTDPSARVHINAGLPTGTINTVGPFRVDASTGSSESASFEVEVRNTTDGGQYASIQSYNSNTSSGLNAVPLKIQRNGGDLHVGGNVGIGTDSPTGELQVHSNSSSGTNFYLTNGFDSNTNSHWRMQADYDGKFHLGMFSSSFYKRLTISPTGNIGIGTDSPTGELQVHSNSSSGTNFYLTNGFDSNTNSHWRMQADYDGTFYLGMFSSSFHKRLTISQAGTVGIGINSPEEITELTNDSVGYKLIVRGDTSTGTSIMLHNSYEDATHSPQTWRMIADPSKKHFAIGQQGSSFYPRLKLHSGELGGFTFGEDGNGEKENFSTIRFPRTGVYPSLDLIRNEVINELTSKNYPGSGTVIQFGALKNDLDENYDAIPGTRGPQAGARVHGGLYPARNAREDAPKNDRYPNNYGQFAVDVLESSTGSMVNRMTMSENGLTTFYCKDSGGQKTYSTSSLHPAPGLRIRNEGDPDQAKFSGIGFQSSGGGGGYATGWIGVVNGVGGQPTGDMVFGTRMPDGTENAYGERMRLTQNGDLYIGPKGSTNALKTNKMYYIKSAPYTWTGNDKVNDDIAAIGMGSLGTGQDDGEIIFHTATNVNLGGELEQRMRIAHNGHVSINGNLSVGDKRNDLADKSHFDIFADHNNVASRTWSFSSPSSSMGNHPVSGYHFFTLRIPHNANENSWGVMDIDISLESAQSAGHTHQVVKSAKIFINRPTQNTANNNSPVMVRIDNIGDNLSNEDGSAASVNSFDLSYQVTGAGTEVQYVKLLVNTTGDAAAVVNISGIASFKGSNNIQRS